MGNIEEIILKLIRETMILLELLVLSTGNLNNFVKLMKLISEDMKWNVLLFRTSRVICLLVYFLLNSNI